MLNLIKELYEQGMSSYKIAKQVGISPTSVRRKLHGLGLSTYTEKGKKYTCKNCGNVILGRGKSYCSNICQGAYTRNRWTKSWLQGEVPTVSETAAIKAALIQVKGSRCEQCGWSEIHPVTGNVPVELHHIDGDASNNKFANLQLLCPNCHSLTPNYGNIGNRLSSRKKRPKLTNHLIAENESS